MFPNLEFALDLSYQDFLKIFKIQYKYLNI